MYKSQPLLIRLIILFLAGSAASLAFAPTYLFFILFFSFPVLLFLLNKSESYKESFLLGWSFGFGFFLCGLYWISYALLVDQDMFGWLVPFAVTLIPAILAIYIGIITLLLHKVRKDSLRMMIAFISLWVLIEILRTKLFTGFPWLALGYSLSNKITLIQSASLVGVFGISFVILLITLVPFVLLKEYKEQKVIALTYTSCAFILFALNFAYGTWTLENAERDFLPHSIRVIQPNIKQSIKWDKKYKEKNLQKIMNLSVENGNEPNTYIVWPEAAITHSLNDINIRNVIKTIIPEESYLITGGVRISGRYPMQIAASLFMIGNNGNIVDYYDKMHLVPFGEYIPLRDLIPFNISKITYGLIDFTPGDKAKIITPKKNLPSFRALICYESFFPQETLLNEQKPDFLLNITNDAWYRDSPGPYQHLDMTKFRSIEYGLPMIRSANTGISAIVNPYGEILQQLNLNQTGYLTNKLPKSKKNKTFYHLHANNILIFILAIILLSIFVRRKPDGN
ncbi:MAG: apolipoprotein N-acyltransferase [Alphaproteobacteria bacterium]|nr:apolipoprotein N-acyltransferase [Alphaproteobacteria bacterium]